MREPNRHHANRILLAGRCAACAPRRQQSLRALLFGSCVFFVSQLFFLSQRWRARRLAKVHPLLLVLVVLVALALPSTALAEADYGGSRPAQEGTVPTLPNPLELDFTEAVRSVTVTVVGPDPSLVASQDVPRVIDHTTTFTPLRDLGPGRYQVTWSSVSDVDGSKANGTFSFYVIPEAAPPPIPDTANAKFDPRVDSFSKRQAIRERFRGQLDEALFNALLAQGKPLDVALAAAKRSP
jgi:methionine-rich copper-binding protein CopC